MCPIIIHFASFDHYLSSIVFIFDRIPFPDDGDLSKDENFYLGSHFGH